MKKIPELKSETEEREFWETHDSTDYLDMSKAQLVVFPNLKPATKAISLRLPEELLARIKVKANKQDEPYQSLIKTWLAEKAAKPWPGEGLTVRIIIPPFHLSCCESCCADQNTPSGRASAMR